MNTDTQEPKLNEEAFELSADHEKFCRTYTSLDFLGNGVQAYMEVYGNKEGKQLKYDSAKANAYRLLTNPKIIARINELLELGGFTEENVDKQHLFLLNQFGDLKTKMAAIKEYNALKKRTSPENSQAIGITFTDEQLTRIARGILVGDRSGTQEPHTLRDSNESQV